jgi:type VI secretion system Hcp family effector
MHPTNRRVAFVLALFLCLKIWAGPAQAAYQFYATIEGTKQGIFKGQGAGREKGRIPCLQFRYQANAPGDAAGGQVAGKRQHGQIIIVKEVDAASPQLFRALSTHEVLSHVDLEFIHVASDGREAVYKTLRITNAEAASIHTLAGGGANARGLEEVTLIFESTNLEVKGPDAKPIPVERWIDIEK